MNPLDAMYAAGAAMDTSPQVTSVGRLVPRKADLSGAIKTGTGDPSYYLSAMTPEQEVAFAAKNAAEQKQLEGVGIAIAASDRRVSAGRDLLPTAGQKRGFDIATALCRGSWVNGPEFDRVFRNLGIEERVGFPVGQALQFGISKQGMVDRALSANSTVAAGQLVAEGIIGSGVSGDQKAAAISGVVGNAQAREGAAGVLEANKSLFTRFLEFFGLA